MSWAFNHRGSKEEVENYLAKDALVAIKHIEGVERDLAEQALDLARETFSANTDPGYEVSVSANGSASITDDDKEAHWVSVIVSAHRK